MLNRFLSFMGQKQAPGGDEGPVIIAQRREDGEAEPATRRPTVDFYTHSRSPTRLLSF
jgi:hypothetical protein